MSQSPIALDATSSSGLPVTYRVMSGPGTVEGNLLTLTGVGTVSVRAEQAGNEQFRAATLERSIAVQLPPTPIAITGTRLAPDGLLRFELAGLAGTQVVLESSQDLNKWEKVSTHTVPSSVEILLPTMTGFGFFRVVVQP